MKRIIKATAMVMLVIGVGSWLYFSSFSSQRGHVDGSKIISAVKIYKDDLKGQGMEVPASVSVRELITRGFLTEADVSGFSGINVSVSLSADESSPQDVLVRARLPDGQEIVALGDGSVQQVQR